jgi:hypothetical protein
MPNWLEMEVSARERIADADQWAANERLAKEARRTAREKRRDTASRARAGRTRRPVALVLARGEVLSVRVGRRGLSLACVAGRVWATSGGSADDIILAAGQVTTIANRGTVVIEALRTATIRVDYLRQPQTVFSPWSTRRARPGQVLSF